MAFCTGCGAPLTGPFCVKCGTPAQSAGAPSSARPQAPPQAPAPKAPPAAAAGVPAKSSGGLGKVLLIVAGIVVVFVVGAIGAALYGVHWVKSKISTATGGTLGGSQTEVTSGPGDYCKLLSTTDLQGVLGVTVEKDAGIMDGDEPGCAYYTNPEAFAQLQKMALEEAKKEAAEGAKKQGPNTKTDNPLELLKDTKDLEGVVKSFGLSQPDKDGRVFSFSVQRDYDSSNWDTLRATLSVVPGFEEIPGVGDKAMVGSFGHALYVLKGSNVIHLDLTYVPNSRTQGVEIGKIIASHL
jgi:hypothetical protein